MVYVAITTNRKAKDYEEYESMVTVQLHDKNISTTDFIFNKNGKLKCVKSELSKEELKTLVGNLINKYIDRYYEKY